MGKTYTHVTNDQRKELIRLIHEEQCSISQAAQKMGIYYPTAKAINKVFRKEQRVQKRDFRYRSKKDDSQNGITRNKIPVERLGERVADPLARARITCGVRPLQTKKL